MIMWLFLIISLVAGQEESGESRSESTEGCGCETEIYGPDQEAGIIKSPNYPHYKGCNGECIYIIEPHPNKSVSLYTAHHEISTHSVLEIFSLFYVDGKRFLLFQARIKRTSSYYYSSADESFPSFISAMNAGFEIRYSCSQSSFVYNSFKISFDRYYDYGELCDHPLVIVSMKETVVQREHEFTSASGCVYYLKANESEVTSNEDEFLIEVKASEENMVSTRSLDEPGRVERTSPTTSEQAIRTSTYISHVVSHKSTRTDGSYEMTKITARLVATNCQCRKAQFTFASPNISQVRIVSPGYPDLYCPDEMCKYQTSYEVDDYNTNLVALLEVRINAFLSADDSLKISNSYETFFQNDRYASKPKTYNEFFVVKQQSLDVKYESGSKYSKRSAEINMTQVLVQPDCVCTRYKEKKVTKEFDLHAVFNRNCTYVFCHYTFVATRYKRFALEFYTVGQQENDIIMIKDDDHIEKYEGNMLKIIQRYETNQEIEVYFYRDMKNTTTSDTVLGLWWMEADTESKCDGQRRNIECEIWNKQAFVSPGYPKNYPDDQNCEYLFTKPDEAHHIKVRLDEVSLEKYHDHIRFYAGNTTDAELLYTFTGYHSNVTLNFTTAPILMVFQTDRSTSDRGFHITVYYIDWILPVKSSDNTLTYLLIAVILLFLIIILIGVYGYKAGYLEKLKRTPTEQVEQRRIVILDSQSGNEPNPSASANFDTIFE